MDGECLKLDSNIGVAKKLCGRRVEDRISDLPDEILLVVLSFVSLREAVTTGVLSSRWLDLWKHKPYLNFRSKGLNLINTTSSEEVASAWSVERCKHVELVNTVLQLHKAPSLKKFKISFYVNNTGQAAVAKWLEIVFSRHIESLELDFKCEVGSNMVVLEELLSESRISVILFKSLKRLCLRSFKVSGEDIKLFLCNCPLLKRLVILSSNLVSDVEICGTNHDHRLMLKHLDIRWCYGTANSIKVSGAPNLTWISVDESSGKLSIENVPKLVDLCFRIGRQEYVAQQFASVVSCFISQLRYLTLTLLHPKEFLAHDQFPKMPNLKKLVVEDFGVYEQGSFLPITALIRASPRLQHFILKFFGNLKDAASHMEDMKKRYKHQHLKTFEFQGSCVGVSDHIAEFVTYTSDNCVALRKIIIGRPRRDTSEIRDEVQARDYLKQQLQGKLPHSIQLQFLE